ncbi:hypothetical protein C8R46DRAFT_240797 [Mycena filopes]|nr:hypothetical protein C8R46DRAFT_240797 [Mycena filopes]
MDGADYTDTEASNGFASDDPEVVANHAGGIFPGCQNFTVTGGTYTNILQSTDVVPSDFRRIPMGDIYLQDNLSGDFSTTRRHLAQRSFFRRMFSAKIPGHTSNVTVATYQGDRAEEEWREDVTRYMSFRHHNILQLFATAAMKNIYAAVFHCDFVTYYLPPVSPIVETYVRGVWVADFWAISEYVELEGIDWTLCSGSSPRPGNYTLTSCRRTPIICSKIDLKSQIYEDWTPSCTHRIWRLWLLLLFPSRNTRCYPT